MMLTHLLAKLYEDLGISLSLVGSEVWNEGDEIAVSPNVYETLDSFLAWREQDLLPQQHHDFALLVSGTTFMHHMKSHTYHGEMCSPSFSAAVLEDHSDDVVQVANDAAHSIGHNIGLRHDSSECECRDATKYCIMDIVKRKQPPTKFSTCSKQLLANHLAMGRLDCLEDRPSYPRGPLCGNGLVEEGEECDCGEPQECSDACCVASECRRMQDCDRRSSQIVAAAEVVTAPIEAPATERQAAPVSADISSLSLNQNAEINPNLGRIEEDLEINRDLQRVEEEVEERFNTIDTDALLVANIPEPLATVLAKLSTTSTTLSTDTNSLLVANNPKPPATLTTHVKMPTTPHKVETTHANLPAMATSLSSLNAEENEVGLDEEQNDIEVTERVISKPAIRQQAQTKAPSTTSPATRQQLQLSKALPTTPPVLAHYPEQEIEPTEGASSTATPVVVNPNASNNGIHGSLEELDPIDGSSIVQPEKPDVATTRATCTVASILSPTTGVNSAIYGEQAEVEEIMQRLGITELSDPPMFVVEPDPELYIVTGRDLKLNCEASGLSVISYIWLKDGEEIDIPNDPRMWLRHGNLTIQFPGYGDVGIYQCLVSNIYTTAVSPKSSVKRAAMGRFSASPGTIREVNVGDPAILACNPPLSVPPPLISWALNASGEPIAYSRRISQDPRGNLVIANAKERDSGLYHCIVVNEVMGVRIESPRINLIVKKSAQPPRLVYSPQSTETGLQGEQLSLKCVAVGNPVPQIWWERRGDELPTNRSSHTSYGQELVITDLQPQDAGSYVCIADNGAGDRVEYPVTLQVKAAPTLVALPQSVTVPVGVSISFHCGATGDPTPTITWLINNQPVEEVSQSVQLEVSGVDGQGTLTILQTSDVDSSSAVQCVATNRYGSIITNAHLTVLALAAMFREKPKEDLVVLEGLSVTLSCQAIGAPRPMITWWKNGNEKVLIDGRRLQLEADGSLSICRTNVSDATDYTCVVDNKYGYDTARTRLIVRNQTRLTQPPADTNITIGDPLELSCGVTSDLDLEVTITWTNPWGQQVSLVPGSEGTLRISEVSVEDSGVYTCTGETEMDSVSASASVLVQEPSVPLLCGNGVLDEEEECDRGLYNASNPDTCCTRDCRWREDTQCREDSACCEDCRFLPASHTCESPVQLDEECLYQSFCTGQSPECRIITRPNGNPCRNGGKCINGRCVPFCEARGLESCNCTRGTDICLECCMYGSTCRPFHGPPGYAVIPRQDQQPLTCGRGGRCNQGVCVGEAPTTTATPLTTTPAAPPETTPTLRQTTPTEAQTTPTLRQTTPTVAQTTPTERHTTPTVRTALPITAVEVPSAPLEVVLTSLSSPLDVQLSWSMEPEDQVSQFDVEARNAYSRGSWSVLASVPGDQMVARVALYPYMTYQFRVTAVNSVGRSRPRETRGVYFTPPARPVANPSDVRVEAKDGQVVVQWQPVDPEKQGAPLFSYKVLWRYRGSSRWSEETVHMFAQSFLIRGSSEDEAYEVSVQSVNAVGAGPEPQVYTYGTVVTTAEPTTTPPPYLEIVQSPPEAMRILVGSRLFLPCSAEGAPPPRIVWFFNNQQIYESNQIELAENGHLTIDPTDLSNTGTYECRAFNQAGGETKTAASQVSVVAPMLAFTTKPPPSLDVLLGNSLVLPCEAAGFPQPTLSWRFNQLEIDYRADIFMADNKSIIIPSASQSHAGFYQCIISNGPHNVKTSESRVSVRDPIFVSINSPSVITTLGSTVTLPCRVTHDHSLTRVYWTRDVTEVYDVVINETLSADYSLTIESITLEDRGVYSCIAETAIDTAGDAVQLRIQTVPSPPSAPTVTKTDQHLEVSVTFDAPFDGNAPISSYTVEYSSPEAEVPWQVVERFVPGDSSQISTTIALLPYFAYYVRARALNEFGESEPSEASKPVYLDPAPPSRNPADVEALVLDDNSNINITWQPLNKWESNGPGFYYIVDWRGANQQFGQMLTVVDFRQTGVSLAVDPSLMPYEVMIQAGNDIGLGPVPDIITVGVEEAGLAVPDAPTKVAINMISPTSINVTWTPLPKRPSYGNVYGYRVVVQPMNALPGVRPLNCLSTTTNCEIFGLIRGTEYRVTVIASGDGGEGYSSFPLTVSVSGELPSAVRKMKVRAWARTMLIKWDPPESGDIQGYVVTHQQIGGSRPVKDELLDSPFDTSLKLGSLLPGTSYRISVMGYNQAGRGEPRTISLKTKDVKSKRSHNVQ